MFLKTLCCFIGFHKQKKLFIASLKTLGSQPHFVPINVLIFSTGNSLNIRLFHDVDPHKRGHNALVKHYLESTPATLRFLSPLEHLEDF